VPQLPFTLGISGLAVGFLGTVILAFSLNRVFEALKFATDAHDIAITGLTTPRSDVYVFQGTDEHVDRGHRTAVRMTHVGLWLLALSFALQTAARIASLPG
jgi:hypothetical protein